MTRQEIRENLSEVKDELEEKAAELVGYLEDVRRCKAEIVELVSERIKLRAKLAELKTLTTK